MYEALKGVIADTDGEDERFLALVESNQRRMAKSPSETVISESFSDDKGKVTRREVCIGEEVAAVGGLIHILEAEVNQLWDAWEAADREVQARLIELDGGASLTAGKIDCAKGVREILAEDMKAFDAEAEGIIEDSHEEAQACEKVSFDAYCLESIHFCSHVSRNSAKRSMAPCPLFCSSFCWKTEEWRVCQKSCQPARASHAR